MFPKNSTTKSQNQVKENILIGDVVYIVGHKAPDMDAIVSAHAYQAYRHTQGDFNYVAIRCDEPNEVTKWAYERWGLEMPALVRDVSGKKIVLVDHTDPEQRPDGWDEAEIIEVVDHHKLKLETSSPPKITIKPYGSTATLISQKMIRRGIKLEPKLAGLMLAALIDDTLALRSPITTRIDKQIAGVLAAEAGIVNLSDYAREQFSQKDVWDKMTAEQVCTEDMKNYEIGNLHVRIAQVETMDNRKFTKKIPRYFNFIKGARVVDNIDISIVLITDLIRNDCIAVVSAEEDNIRKFEEAFNTKIANNVVQLPGVVSRKKQIVPPLVELFGGNNK